MKLKLLKISYLNVNATINISKYLNQTKMFSLDKQHFYCIFGENVIEANLRFSNFIVEGNFTDLMIAIVRIVS